MIRTFCVATVVAAIAVGIAPPVAAAPPPPVPAPYNPGLRARPAARTASLARYSAAGADVGPRPGAPDFGRGSRWRGGAGWSEAGCRSRRREAGKSDRHSDALTPANRPSIWQLHLSGTSESLISVAASGAIGSVADRAMTVTEVPRNAVLRRHGAGLERRRGRAHAIAPGDPAVWRHIPSGLDRCDSRGGGCAGDHRSRVSASRSREDNGATTCPHHVGDDTLDIRAGVVIPITVCATLVDGDGHRNGDRNHLPPGAGDHAHNRRATEYHRNGPERHLEGVPPDASTPLVQRISVGPSAVPVTTASRPARCPA